MSRKRNGSSREGYSETVLNSSASFLVYGYSAFCCSSVVALVYGLSEYKQNCTLLNAVDRGQFVLTH